MPTDLAALEQSLWDVAVEMRANVDQVLTQLLAE